MAKKEETPKTVLERVYIVPLRREFQKVPSYKRAKKAVKALREFIAKHMKSENVIIGKYANQLLWKNGIKNPPHHVKVTAVKDEKGKVTAELAELSPKAKRELEKDKQLKEKKEGREAEKKKAEEPKKEEAKKGEKERRENRRKSRGSKKRERRESKRYRERRNQRTNKRASKASCAKTINNS